MPSKPCKSGQTLLSPRWGCNTSSAGEGSGLVHETTSHPSILQKIVTPLNLQACEIWLNMHPAWQEYASYLLDGIANGFRIGFSHATHACTAAKQNHTSANKHPSVISEGLANEFQKGRLIGPLNPRDYLNAQISCLGAIPKKHSGK